MRISLAQRELGHLANQRHTFLLRMLAPIMAFAGLVIATSGSDLFEALLPYANSRGVGVGATYTINYLFQLGQRYEYLVVLVAAPLTAAVLLAEEKQSDTLRLLLVTTFRPRDIVLSKFAVATMQSLVLVFAVVPIWGLAVFFGGVSFEKIWISAFLFGATCLAASAVGIYLGAALNRTLDAMLGAAMLLGGWMAVAHLVDTRLAWLPFPLSIFTALDNISYPSYSMIDWAAPAVIAVVVTPVFLAAAVAVLPGSVVRERPTQIRRRIRFTWLPWNRPMAVVASSLSSGIGERLRSGAYFSAVMLLLTLLAAVPIFGWIVVLGILLYDVTAPIAHAHQSTAWHDLMTTPMTDAQLTFAIFMGQIRRNFFFLPAIFVAGTPALLLVGVIRDMDGYNVAMQIVTFVRHFNGGLIFAIYILIHLAQGVFIVALGTYLGTLGRNAFWQTVQALVLVAAVYTLFTAAGQEFATEASREAMSKLPAGVDRRPTQFRVYAITLGWVYLLPYAVATAAIGLHLCAKLRVLMGMSTSEPGTVWTILSQPLRLPRLRKFTG